MEWTTKFSYFQQPGRGGFKPKVDPVQEVDSEDDVDKDCFIKTLNINKEVSKCYERTKNAHSRALTGFSCSSSPNSQDLRPLSSSPYSSGQIREFVQKLKTVSVFAQNSKTNFSNLLGLGKFRNSKITKLFLNFLIQLEQSAMNNAT